MEAFLSGLLPRLLREVPFSIHPFQCKDELLGRLPDRLLNQTLGDWHRGALADRSMVTRPIVPSVRTCCAQSDDSGYPYG